jgi:hypothetical protein
MVMLVLLLLQLLSVFPCHQSQACSTPLHQPKVAW